MRRWRLGGNKRFLGKRSWGEKSVDEKIMLVDTKKNA